MNDIGPKIHFLDYNKLKYTLNNIMTNIEKYATMTVPNLPRILFEIGIAEKG